MDTGLQTPELVLKVLNRGMLVAETKRSFRGYPKTTCETSELNLNPAGKLPWRLFSSYVQSTVKCY
jgi:hypothetical protein